MESLGYLSRHCSYRRSLRVQCTRHGVPAHFCARTPTVDPTILLIQSRCEWCAPRVRRYSLQRTKMTADHDQHRRSCMIKVVEKMKNEKNESEARKLQKEKPDCFTKSQNKKMCVEKRAEKHVKNKPAKQKFPKSLCTQCVKT